MKDPIPKNIPEKEPLKETLILEVDKVFTGFKERVDQEVHDTSEGSRPNSWLECFAT